LILIVVNHSLRASAFAVPQQDDQIRLNTEKDLEFGGTGETFWQRFERDIQELEPSLLYRGAKLSIAVEPVEADRRHVLLMFDKKASAGDFDDPNTP
jgi:hypothetical protein